jgi:hypothetical protein
MQDVICSTNGKMRLISGFLKNDCRSDEMSRTPDGMLYYLFRMRLSPDEGTVEVKTTGCFQL